MCLSRCRRKMAEQVRGLDALKSELSRAKDGLKDYDKTIAKLTGRDANDPRPPVGRGRGGGEFRGRGRLFNMARRGVVDDTAGPPAKRRAVGGAFSRLGPAPGILAGRLGPRNHYNHGEEEVEEEWDPTERPSIQSSIVATPIKDNRSREDLAENLNTDEKSKSRNRRMFGLLMGTLQKFQVEEKQKTDKEHKRKVVEERLEHKAREEKDQLRKDKQDLFRKRKQQELKVKLLEQKMELARIHEEWEKQTLCLGNFIRTKSKPHVYYLPKAHTGTSERRLKDTKKLLKEAIADRKKQLEEEIEELTSQATDERTPVKSVSHRRERQGSSKAGNKHDDSGHGVGFEAGEEEMGMGSIAPVLAGVTEEHEENGQCKGSVQGASDVEEGDMDVTEQEKTDTRRLVLTDSPSGKKDNRRIVTTDSPTVEADDSRDSPGQFEGKQEIVAGETGEIGEDSEVTDDKRDVVMTAKDEGKEEQVEQVERMEQSEGTKRTIIKDEIPDDD